MTEPKVLSIIEKNLFVNRKLIISLFLLITLVMIYFVSQLKVDAGFNKLLPLEHEYMNTFIQYHDEFGGANRILVALVAKKGDIFNPEFFNALKQATDEVFFIPGVDRTRVMSLFTPNVRFTEVVEDGISGGNVIPDSFQGKDADFQIVKQNILKAGILGKLVANDFSGALVSAQLLEIDPDTGEKLDYMAVARQLEEKLRKNNSNNNIEYHIIGFAKIVGDIADATTRVILFFIITFLIISLLVIFYSQSLTMAIMPLTCSLIAVLWQLGMLPILGMGLDPMSILVPFLIFAIGVSHGVQMVSSIRVEMFMGANSFDAARKSFRRLFIPGMVALLSDGIGFVTILVINIGIVQEMAITASLGIAMIILTNLFLLPILLSYLNPDKSFITKLNKRADYLCPIWQKLSFVTKNKIAIPLILCSLGLFGYGIYKAQDIKIGDSHSGVPELRSDSRYNIDSNVITEKFSIGVDVITVIAETIPQGCIDYDVMNLIDRFAWHIQNTKGVQSVMTLPNLVKQINAGWNEGSMKWRVIPRNPSLLAQSVAYIPTSTGLLNSDCSVMPVMIFTENHKSETIKNVIKKIKQFSKDNPSKKLVFKLATGNVGVMAATNEEIESAQFPILIYVFSIIILLCLITFRSITAVLSIIFPLSLVSVLAYALMTYLEIGLKVNTLPVVALGIGIGVDYGIYIYSRLKLFLNEGLSLERAYFLTLSTTGFSVIFTGITLAVGVVTWIFSPLKFQADMGILLTFMFLLNMLGAIFLLPAITGVLYKR